MRTDQELDEILAEIGRSHRAIGAPESVEDTLCAATASRGDAAGVRRLRPAWAWGFAVVLLAAVAWSGTVWEMRRSREVHDRQARNGQVQSGQVRSGQVQSGPVRSGPVQRGPVPVARPEAPSLSEQVEARGVSAPLRGVGADRIRPASPDRPARHSLEEFVPLPVSEGLPPATELSVVRVTLLGSDLEQYGLEAPADAAARTMLAEFVVGEDGLPRAIRIVQ